MVDLDSLARRACNLENNQTGGEVGPSGVPCWKFVFNMLPQADVQRLADMSDEQLETFLFSDNSNDPVWEQMMSLLATWEDQIMGED